MGVDPRCFGCRWGAGDVCSESLGWSARFRTCGRQVVWSTRDHLSHRRGSFLSSIPFGSHCLPRLDETQFRSHDCQGCKVASICSTPSAAAPEGATLGHAHLPPRQCKEDCPDREKRKKGCSSGHLSEEERIP